MSFCRHHTEPTTSCHQGIRGGAAALRGLLPGHLLPQRLLLRRLLPQLLLLSPTLGQGAATTRANNLPRLPAFQSFQGLAAATLAVATVSVPTALAAAGRAASEGSSDGDFTIPRNQSTLAGNVADMCRHVGLTWLCWLFFPEKACRGDTRHAKRGPDTQFLCIFLPTPHRTHQPTTSCRRGKKKRGGGFTATTAAAAASAADDVVSEPLQERLPCQNKSR